VSGLLLMSPVLPGGRRGLAAICGTAGRTLFAGFAVASLAGPSALGGPLAARLNPRTAMTTGSVILGLAVAGVLISVGQSSAPGFLTASIAAGLAFGSAFHGGMRTLMGGLAPGHRAGPMSGIYLFQLPRRGDPRDLVGVSTYLTSDSDVKSVSPVKPKFPPSRSVGVFNQVVEPLITELT
jgi:hypothetical protein